MRKDTKNNTITLTEYEANLIYVNGLTKLVAGNNRVVLERLSKEAQKMTRDFKMNNLEKKMNKILKKHNFKKAVEIYKQQFFIVSLSTEPIELKESVLETLEIFSEFSNILESMIKPTINIDFNDSEVVILDINPFRTTTIAA